METVAAVTIVKLSCVVYTEEERKSKVVVHRDEFRTLTIPKVLFALVFYSNVSYIALVKSFEDQSGC